MATTAVIAGTATAVSGRVSNRQQAKQDQQAYEASADQAAVDSQSQIADMQAQMAQMQAQQAASAMPAAAAPAGPDLTSQLQQLASLKSQGILNDAEFETAKSKLLAG